MISATEESSITNEEISIYPNPSSGEVYFSNLSGWDDFLRIEVTDQLGHIIYGPDVSKYSLQAGLLGQLNSLSHGVYQVTLKDSNKQGVVKMVRILR